MGKNILLFMTDQQRWDQVGYAGCEGLTPNIDRIASHAHFTGCQTGDPICTPAPMETENRVADPACAERLREARRRMDYTVDRYPAAQLTWSTACAADRKL